MAITGKVKTMYEDAEKTKAIFPRTKTSAISDGNGVALDVLLSNLSNDTDQMANEVESLKKSVSDGKTLVANAITEKGVSTSSNDTFETMATNIESIQQGSDNYKGYTIKTGTLQSYSVSTVNSNRTITFPTGVIPLSLKFNIVVGSSWSWDQISWIKFGSLFTGKADQNNRCDLTGYADLEVAYGGVENIPSSISYDGASTEAKREYKGTVSIVKWLEPLNSSTDDGSDTNKGELKIGTGVTATKYDPNNITTYVVAQNSFENIIPKKISWSASMYNASNGNTATVTITVSCTGNESYSQVVTIPAGRDTIRTYSGVWEVPVEVTSGVIQVDVYVGNTVFYVHDVTVTATVTEWYEIE